MSTLNTIFNTSYSSILFEQVKNQQRQTLNTNILGSRGHGISPTRNLKDSTLLPACSPVNNEHKIYQVLKELGIERI